jgi:Leucine-rich repeat (LRR) protein
MQFEEERSDFKEGHQMMQNALDDHNYIQFNSSDISSHPSLDLDRDLSYYALDVENLDQLCTECHISNSQKVKSLRVMHCASFTSLKGLGYFKQLTILNLSSNSIMSMQGIECVPLVEDLNLSTNKISQVFGLNKLVNLRKLTLSHNKIVSLEHFEELRGLKQLSYLDLNDNYIGELN